MVASNEKLGQMENDSKNKVIDLYDYQRDLFNDTARVIVVCWCRQAGKDFTTACKAVSSAIEKGDNWYIVSVTQRQADETFKKCKKIAEIYKQLLKLQAEITFSERDFIDYDREIDQQFACTAHTLTLPGGGTVTALPGKDPDSLAGFTGNVIFTEFALFPKGGYDHWRVVFPLTTRGYSVVVISTIRGKNTKFFELLSSDDKYSVHNVTIHDAVAGGLKLTDNNGEPCEIETFRNLYGDEIGWQREYLNQPTGDLDALIKWGKLIAAGDLFRQHNCKFDLLRISNDAGWQSGFFKRLLLNSRSQRDGRWEMGWDVARRRDLSALWINERRNENLVSLRCLVIMKNTSFALQREIITEAMRAPMRNNSIGFGDSTGMGMDSNETLSDLFHNRWFGLDFTGKSKRELGSIMINAYDDGAQAIPHVESPHKFIATDIYAIQKDGEKATMRLVESSNPLEIDSHCDIAYASALALKAGQVTVPQPWISNW